MIAPDLSNRQECCGAPRYQHWSDCPVADERRQAEELAAERARIRLGHSVMRDQGGCQCGICAAAAAGHL